ncbi:MAG: 4Fe-4S binding protein [Dehalococcoidia bacterium]|jgi:ferredoxin
MDNEDMIYRYLQQHMDRLPGGFPAVESGLDITLLKHFFTPDEAGIALQLSMKPEPLDKIHRRVTNSGRDMSESDLQQMLEDMMRKGIILTVHEGYDETHYCNAEFAMGGIFNFQLNRLTEDLLKTYHQYQAERRTPGGGRSGVGPPLRIVPVAESIPVPEKYPIADYEDVRQLIRNATGEIAVANCICRLTSGILESGCKKTDLLEACIMIGPDHARRHVEMGIGRYISKEEAFSLLDKARQDGLVLQPENSQHPEAICCCCGDCCVLLKSLTRHPRPVELFATNFVAEFNAELCNGCGICVDKCQLGAREMVEGVAVHNLDRCIGCGACVVHCSQDANTLKRKEPVKIPLKDKTTVNMKTLSGKVGKWNMLKIRAKMLLGMQV